MISHHIAVVGTPDLGHAIPTLDVLTELVRRGHRLTVITAGPPVAAVAATGATVVEYESVLAGMDLAVLNTVTEMDRLMQLGVMEDEVVLRAMEKHFVDEKPDLIICDATRLVVGPILAHKWNRPAAAFYTIFLSNERFSLWESVQKKRGKPDSRRRTQLAEALQHLIRLLAAHGQDFTLEDFYRPREDLYLAFFPRSFQFAGDTFNERYVFVGPNLRHGLDPGEWAPPANGRPLLLISLGTSVHRQPEFFRMCVEAFTDSPWHVVMHAHAGVGELGPLPANVEVHGWLPLLAVLEHAEAFLCHGGMGSLMASMARATPVVVVPSAPEQMINADRVTELGLGRVIQRDALNRDLLRTAVDEVATDPGIRDRVHDMQRDILDAGGGSYAADAIEACLRGRLANAVVRAGTETPGT
jgi:dTDP-L-oleandrosyltransferase